MNNNDLNPRLSQLVIEWRERANKAQMEAARYSGTTTAFKAIARTLALESCAIELEEAIKNLPKQRCQP